MGRRKRGDDQIKTLLGTIVNRSPEEDHRGRGAGLRQRYAIFRRFARAVGHKYNVRLSFRLKRFAQLNERVAFVNAITGAFEHTKPIAPVCPEVEDPGGHNSLPADSVADVSLVP